MPDKVDRGPIINALNDAIKRGELIVKWSGLFGAGCVATTDNAAEIEHVQALPRGNAGAIWHEVDHWELRVKGQVIARFANKPWNRSLHEPYARATRWLYLKLQKRTGDVSSLPSTVKSLLKERNR